MLTILVSLHKIKQLRASRILFLEAGVIWFPM